MSNTGKITIFTLCGILILLAAGALAGFFIMFRGTEITVVPEVRGMQIEDALVAVQDKGLNSKIQLRYSQKTGDRGKILEQSPSPGSLLRAGKHVTLCVSRGAVIDKIGDYTGWKIQDLKSHLSTLSSTYGTSITIKEPMVHIHNSAPIGTIIKQKPQQGTPITGDVQLELVVSQGTEDETLKVPSLKGMDFMTALSTLTELDIPFAFSRGRSSGSEKPGTVVSQTPNAGSTVKKGSMIQLQITAPIAEEGKIFGILECKIPNYPVAIDLKCQTIDLNGNRSDIFTMKHKGGAIALPYYVDEGSAVVLYAGDKELVNFVPKK